MSVSVGHHSSVTVLRVVCEHESISENQRQLKPECVCVCVLGKLNCIVTPNTMIVLADFVYLVRNRTV